MKKYSIKFTLCILVFLLYADLIYLCIMDTHGLIAYMLLGMGIVSLFIGSQIYFKNEREAVKHPNAKSYNVSNIDSYVMAYYIFFALVLWIVIIAISYYNQSFLYLIPSFLSLAFLCITKDFDRILLDKEAFYTHGKWYAYEDMESFQYEVGDEFSCLDVCFDHQVKRTFIIRKKESDEFITTLHTFVKVEAHHEHH